MKFPYKLFSAIKNIIYNNIQVTSTLKLYLSIIRNDIKTYLLLILMSVSNEKNYLFCLVKFPTKKFTLDVTGKGKKIRSKKFSEIIISEPCEWIIIGDKPWLYRYDVNFLQS